MRPMIRLGNLNARPSCPAAAPGSTVWVYLYAAGRRDMPGDSPAGNRRLSGTRAQDGKIADDCAKEKPPSPGNGRRTDGTAWVRKFFRQELERHIDSQGDNSHTIEIEAKGLTIRMSNTVQPMLLKILMDALKEPLC